MRGVAVCERLVSEYKLTSTVGVGSLRRDLGPAAGESAELFRALRALIGPSGRLYWALGADVASGMRSWRAKVEECTRPGETCDGLLVFKREGASDVQVTDCKGLFSRGLLRLGRGLPWWAAPLLTLPQLMGYALVHSSWGMPWYRCGRR
jgi:hypothetical protein